MQPQHGNLYLWWPCLHTRATPHKARRGDHLRLWERLSQVCDRTLALPVQTMPEAASPQAERGTLRNETPCCAANADAAQKALIYAHPRPHGAGCAAPPFAFRYAYQFAVML